MSKLFRSFVLSPALTSRATLFRCTLSLFQAFSRAHLKSYALSVYGFLSFLLSPALTSRASSFGVRLSLFRAFSRAHLMSKLFRCTAFSLSGFRPRSPQELRSFGVRLSPYISAEMSMLMRASSPRISLSSLMRGLNANAHMLFLSPISAILASFRRESPCTRE